MKAHKPARLGKNPRSLDIVLLIEVLSTLSAWRAVRLFISEQTVKNVL